MAGVDLKVCQESLKTKASVLRMVEQKFGDCVFSDISESLDLLLLLLLLSHFSRVQLSVTP